MENKKSPPTADEDEGHLKALREASDKYEFYGNKMPLCPHCGAEYDISKNDHWELYDDDERHDATCPACDREFMIETHVKYTFSTLDQED